MDRTIFKTGSGKPVEDSRHNAQSGGKLRQNPLPLVLTVEEMARLLRVNRNTIYEAFQRGELPGGRKVGRIIRFSREAVLKWLQGNDSALHSMKGKS